LSSSPIEVRIGWTFARRELLTEALTHSSSAEGRRGAVTNERLEFLGDRVLGLVVAQRLFATYADDGESALALRLNALVNRSACAAAARRVGLGEALTLSKSEELAGGRNKETILADACEALIAALYLDGGFDAARAFIDLAWGDAFTEAAGAGRDPKTALQEWAAARKLSAPAYVLAARTGPDHAPVFVIQVTVAGRTASGEGGSKRDAERRAALALLTELTT